MFTGIIQDIGSVKNIKTSQSGKEFTIVTNNNLNNLELGASIAVNGACMTVTNYENQQFTFFSSEESLAKTNLDLLQINSHVNLERAAKFGDEIGGHIVSGHVDTTGSIATFNKIDDDGYVLEIQLNDELIKYMIYKGSVTIDGVSLTVNEVSDNKIAIRLIPHTIEKTIFQYAKVGDIVNVEVDMMARYVEKYMSLQYNK